MSTMMVLLKVIVSFASENLLHSSIKLMNICVCCDIIRCTCSMFIQFSIELYSDSDVKVGDELLVDGGMVRFDVIEKIGPDVKCRCTDPGLLLPRANLTFWRDGSLVRERNAMLPTISSKVGSSVSQSLFFLLNSIS